MHKEFCFTHWSGLDVYLFTLENGKGTKAMITNYGAIVTSFSVTDADGKRNDIVLGFDKVEDYLSPLYLAAYPWFGAAIGRYSNRIKHARFSIDDKVFQLTKNDGDNQLHGGLNGFDKKVWHVADYGEAPHPWLELKYLSADGEEGFPGNLDVTVRFELSGENELSYTYHAAADQPTAVNLTHHDYFNLNNGEGTMLDQEIKLYASRYLKQDESQASDGETVPVDKTPFDLREFTRIGNGLEKAGDYDLSFAIDKRDDQLVAEARSLRSNILLQVYSTEPALHFYTGKWIPEVAGKNGQQYEAYSGFCLETHTHPNAVNHPQFPTTILRPGEEYYQKTRYRLIIK